MNWKMDLEEVCVSDSSSDDEFMGEMVVTIE